MATPEDAPYKLIQRQPPFNVYPVTCWRLGTAAEIESKKGATQSALSAASTEDERK